MSTDLLKLVCFLTLMYTEESFLDKLHHCVLFSPHVYRRIVFGQITPLCLQVSRYENFNILLYVRQHIYNALLVQSLILPYV